MGTPVKIWVSEWSREWMCRLTEVTPRALQGWDNAAEGAAAPWVTQGPGFLGPHLFPGRNRAAVHLQQTKTRRRMETSLWCAVLPQRKSQSPPRALWPRKAHALFFSKETLYFALLLDSQKSCGYKGLL